MSRVFAIADLHLSLADPSKSMEVFVGWENYVARLEAGWRATVGAEDVVVVAGDTSWGLELPDALPDFAFLDALPGKKLLLKGNHDYWWSTALKMNAFFAENGFSTLSLLHNNCFETDEFTVCGTRGWMIEADAPADAKVAAREAIRLEASLLCAPQGKERVAFLHYPPVYGGSVAHNMIEVLQKYGVERVYYGHIHSQSARRYKVGEYGGILMNLIAADDLGFVPYEVRPARVGY